MNFDKAAISSKVMEFLEISLTHEEDKKSFARLLKGNKLLYKEANAFIETLLRALTIKDGKEDIPFIPKKAETLTHFLIYKSLYLRECNKYIHTYIRISTFQI